MPGRPDAVMATSLTGTALHNLRADVRNVRVEHILVPRRKRPLDKEHVEELMKNISAVGLLQPIGVRWMTDEERLKHEASGYSTVLVYGAHRQEAHRRLFGNAKTAVTLDEQELGRWEFIPAVVYPAHMPDEWAGLLETTENLLSKSLSADERKAWTADLLGFYKELRLVADAYDARSVSLSLPKGKEVAELGSATSLPTATEKASADFGITERAVQKRVRSVGTKVGKKDLSAEKSSADELHKAADAMRAKIKAEQAEKEAAKKKREADRKTKRAADKRARDKARRQGAVAKPKPEPGTVVILNGLDRWAEKYGRPVVERVVDTWLSPKPLRVVK